MPPAQIERRLICVVSQKFCGFQIESFCGKLNLGLNFENNIMYIMAAYYF